MRELACRFSMQDHHQSLSLSATYAGLRAVSFGPEMGMAIKVHSLWAQSFTLGTFGNAMGTAEENLRQMRKQKGFSLVELLIVVAIILIIAAIAIPNLLRARIAANESAGASTVRTLNTSEVSYITAFPTT